MKLRHRFILLAAGIVAFVLFMSFKILEPELSLNGQNVGGDYINGGFRDVAISSDEEKEDKDPGFLFYNASSRQLAVDALLKKYDLDWTYQLSESPWKIAARWATPRRVHPDIAPEMGGILREMASRAIKSVDVGYRGTQLKLSLELDGGQKLAFKPKWYSRETVITGKPYDGKDRHNGEIAAFHLNRLLGLGRSPLVVGRVIDLEEEVLPVASERLINTFFEKDGNTCFYGKCLYCKGPEYGVCADGKKMEGTMVLWLPRELVLTKLQRHPWGRTYRNKTANWEKDDGFCSKVRQVPLFYHGPRLLDILDASVFDYLIGNADRHHYETFLEHNDSMLVMLDSGKSFGNPYLDEITILAPLYQCCQLRKSTYERLKQLQDGVLTEVLRKILAKDPLAPILTELHYEAMDRRLVHILDMVARCVELNGIEFVLVTDKYSLPPYV